MTASAAVTWLFVPGTTPERFTKAAASPAEAVIVDLEDAVHADRKAEARETARSWLSGGGRAWVRVNAADTAWFDDDVAALLVAPGLQGIVLPKAQDPEVVSDLRRRLGPGRELAALVETAAGVERATEVAGAGAARLLFGNLDFALDVSCESSREALLHARSRLVIASCVAGLPGPVDGVTPEVADVARAEDDARYARSLGFAGKLCIHPGQLAPVAAAFAPSDEERLWATAVIEAYEGSSGVVTGPDGQMIDQPVLDRARTVLARRH